MSGLWQVGYPPRIWRTPAFLSWSISKTAKRPAFPSISWSENDGQNRSADIWNACYTYRRAFKLDGGGAIGTPGHDKHSTHLLTLCHAELPRASVATKQSFRTTSRNSLPCWSTWPSNGCGILIRLIRIAISGTPNESVKLQALSPRDEVIVHGGTWLIIHTLRQDVQRSNNISSCWAVM